MPATSCRLPNLNIMRSLSVSNWRQPPPWPPRPLPVSTGAGKGVAASAGVSAKADVARSVAAAAASRVRDNIMELFLCWEHPFNGRTQSLRRRPDDSAIVSTPRMFHEDDDQERCDQPQQIKRPALPEDIT